MTAKMALGIAIIVLSQVAAWTQPFEMPVMAKALWAELPAGGGLIGGLLVGSAWKARK